jgi:DNA recombination-dependent growth factor C
MKQFVVLEHKGINFDKLDISKYTFNGLRPSQQDTLGFAVVTPIQDLLGGVKLIKLTSQSKSPNKNQVKDIIKVKIEKHLKDVGRNPNKHEKDGFKEDALVEVLSMTYPNPQETINCFFTEDKIYVDSSLKTSDKVLAFLEEAGDMLQAGVNIPACLPEALNSFTTNGIGMPFELGSAIKIIESDERTVTVSKGDVVTSVAEDLVKDGAAVSSLELNFDGKMSFVVNGNLEFKSVKIDKSYEEEIMGESDDDELGSLIIKFGLIKEVFTKFIEEVKLVDHV